MPKILSIKAREILDSRGDPTVEVELATTDGVFRSSVPSGASKGEHEAVELRDGGKRFLGKGVLKAVKNINEIIAWELKGADVSYQQRIDNILIELDNTHNKARLGANAILPVSIAVCRAGAKAGSLELYEYIKTIFNLQFSIFKLPQPCFNILEGGLHAGNDLDIQEFMVIPQADSFKENLRIGSEIYHKLETILKKEFGKEGLNIGDEGGFAPPLNKTKKALDLIMKAAEEAGYKDKIKIGLDCAASHFFQDKKYRVEGKFLTGGDLLKFYEELISEYPILFLEDPFSQEDWGNWRSMNSKLKTKSSKPFLIVGDDLTVTNQERVKKAYKEEACNALILKPNQVGTVSETVAAAKLAKGYGWRMIVSHRSGETCEDFIADLAVGVGAEFIKSGAPSRGERVAK